MSHDDIYRQPGDYWRILSWIRFGTGFGKKQ